MALTGANMAVQVIKGQEKQEVRTYDSVLLGRRAQAAGTCKSVCMAYSCWGAGLRCHQRFVRKRKVGSNKITRSLRCVLITLVMLDRKLW
eukprot:1156473-Pelagomonas_calceolata.AAC.8